MNPQNISQLKAAASQIEAFFIFRKIYRDEIRSFQTPQQLSDKRLEEEQKDLESHFINKYFAKRSPADLKAAIVSACGGSGKEWSAVRKAA